MTEAVATARPRPGTAIAAATVLSLPLGSIYAYSVFLVPLETMLQVGRSELASVFGIAVIFFTIGMNVAPRLFGRVPVTLIIALSAACAAAGVGLAAAAQSFVELAFGYGVLFSLGGGLAYVGVQQCVNAMPLARPGLVNGYLVSLFPLGAMLSAPLFGWGIDTIGIRATLAALAGAVASAGLGATLLMASAGVRLSPPGRLASELPAGMDGRRLTVVFWKLFLVFTCAATAGLMVLSQAAAILAAYGAAKATALAATTGITAAIAAARIAGGLLVDRLPVPVVAASAQVIALAGAMLLTLVPTPEMAIPTLGMIGVGYGLISGVTAGAIALYWPKALFGQTASRIYIAWCLAALVLPVIAARLFDMTGGYHTAVILAGVASLAGILVGASLPRQHRKA